jgi:diguanylate cyclase (GGDEF)-like protein/PAS domain S-box-containing protein
MSAGISAGRSRLSPIRYAVLMTVVALLPVGLLAASSIILASRQVTSDVNKQVQTTAAVSAVVIGRQTADLVTLVRSYATRPSLVLAVAAGPSGDASVESNLASLARAVPGISATFIASPGGTSLATYPLEPTVIGTNFSYRDWYKGLVASGKPYVSNAIVTKEAGSPLAVTITDYILGSSGRPIGILGANYLLGSISSFSASVGRAQGITLTVTDRVGTSLTAGGAHGLVSVAGDPRVRAALAGRSGLLEYAPLLSSGVRGPTELSAYTPVAGTGWTVIASVPASVAFAGLYRLRDTVLVITVALVLILLVGVRAIARSDRRRRESELQVQRRDRELARVLDSTDEGFLSVDAAGAITAWNGRAAELYGWPASDVLGRSFAETVIPPASRGALNGALACSRAGADSTLTGRRVETAALHHDGHEIPVEMGIWANDGGDGFSAFVHDITERVTGRARLSLQARADQLTGLANRFVLLETLNACFGRNTADMLVFVDLDRFKNVNDSLGHEAGDAVIAETARRLCQVNGSDDLVARLGGDEFAIVLRGPLSDTEVTSRCETILESVRKAYELIVDSKVTRCYVGASLGLTGLTGHTAAAEAMREADLALYRAKEAGRDRFRIFDEGLRRETSGRLALEGIIRSALDDGRFVPHLEPIVRLVDEVTLGHEVRLRLEQADGTDVLLSELMEVAEESGLVTEIDKLALGAAVELLTGGGSHDDIVNVRLSARTVLHPGFADAMGTVARRVGIDCRRLGIELSEQVLLQDDQMAATAIDLLHAVGARVGFDRFGRGGYPLAKLQRLKLDFVKIDRALVSELATDEAAARSLLEILFEIASRFHLEVIADGIDTPLQADVLRIQGCYSGQGEALDGGLDVTEFVTTYGPDSRPDRCDELETTLVTVADRRASVSGRGLVS